MEPSRAREIWHGLEAVNAVTYFAPECRAAPRSLGLGGFWQGYFAQRAAPMGRVAPGVVEAVFCNFHPAMVRRALPAAFDVASPEAVLEARAASAGAALRRLAPGAARAAAVAAELLAGAVARGEASGRPLFAANRDLEVPGDAYGALWQAATTLREHRGDAHVAVLTAAGIGGCAAHVLFAATEGVAVEVLRDNRGFAAEDWAVAEAALVARGLLGGDGRPTKAGSELHAEIERRTDELAIRPYLALRPDELAELEAALASVAAGVVGSGELPFPNPIGLPDPRP